MQAPPAVSAKRVGGQRAYDLARRDQPVVLTPVEVEVTELALVDHGPATARVRVTCSAGFYVRSLAHDLGIRLGVGAHLTALRRERSGRSTLADSVGLDRLDGGSGGGRRTDSPHGRPAAGLARRWPSRPTRWRASATARQIAVAEGPDGSAPPSGRLRLIGPSGHLVALAEARAGFLHPVLVLV